MKQLKNTGPFKLKEDNFGGSCTKYFYSQSSLLWAILFFLNFVATNSKLSCLQDASPWEKECWLQDSEHYTCHQNITMNFKSGDNTMEICPKNARGNERLMNRTWDGGALLRQFLLLFFFLNFPWERRYVFLFFSPKNKLFSFITVPSLCYA